jgi:hypothetical protein
MSCQPILPTRWAGDASYGEDNDSADDGCDHDEDDSGEEEGQGKLLLEADVYSPEKLFGAYVSKTGRGKVVGGGHTGMGIDSKYTSVRTSGIRTERT